MENEMITLEDRLVDVSTGDLLRAFNSNKEYLSFEFSVFNVGTVAKVKCTDRYKEPYCNGYDFIIENKSIVTHYTLKEILVKRLKMISEAWTKWCYHQDWDTFLKAYGLTTNKYKRLLKLENN